MIVTLAHHWQIMLVAAVVGLVLGAAFVTARYLTPVVRLRLAANPTERTRLLHRELARLRRLGDAAAVYEEHGRSLEAVELWAEIEFQTLLLARAMRREDRFSAPGRAREGWR